MKKIKLTQNKYALVDEEDFALLTGLVKKWRFNGNYVVGGWPILSMHRVVMGAKKGQQVDHINRNKLDNRRENLRFCTVAQNQMNSRPRRDVPKGVQWREDRKAWIVRIGLNYKNHWVGYFKNLNEAKDAYKQAVIKYHGEFARTKI